MDRARLLLARSVDFVYTTNHYTFQNSNPSLAQTYMEFFLWTDW